jgi:multiple antibiotic resistance protein
VVDFLLATFVTFFVVVDPLGVAPIFVGLTAHDTAQERRRQAKLGTGIAAGVLLVFALGGEPLLRLLGVGLPAFRIAGGLLLLLLSIEMVMARHSGLRMTTESEEQEGERKADISVFPLAIPLIAGPGAITSVVLLMGAASGDYLRQGLVLAVLAVVLAIMLLCLLAATTLMRVLGLTGINVVSRVLGLVVAAVAVQFMIDGLRSVGVIAGTPGIG